MKKYRGLLDRDEAMAGYPVAIFFTVLCVFSMAVLTWSTYADVGSVQVIKSADNVILAVLDHDDATATALRDEFIAAGTTATVQLLPANKTTAYENRNGLLGLVVDSAGNLTLPTLSAAEKVASRRAEIKSWLIEQYERSPILVWNLSSGETKLTSGRWNGLAPRVANTIAWVEMIAAASAVDANLSSDSRWRVLSRETTFPVATWYLGHLTANDAPANGWNTVRDAVATTWYSTAATAAPNGGLGWVTAGTIESGVTLSMAVPSGYSLNSYLLS